MFHFSILINDTRLGLKTNQIQVVAVFQRFCFHGSHPSRAYDVKICIYKCFMGTACSINFVLEFFKIHLGNEHKASGFYANNYLTMIDFFVILIIAKLFVITATKLFHYISVNIIHLTVNYRNPGFGFCSIFNEESLSHLYVKRYR